MARSRTPPIVFAGQIGALSLFLVVLGPLLAHFGLAPPTVGLSMVSFAGVISAVACGLAAYQLARGVRPQNTRGIVGLIGAAVTMSMTFGYAYDETRTPKINDVTTNANDPPAFDDKKVPAYPKENAAIQAAHYPELVGHKLPVSPADAYRRVRDVAHATDGWRITVDDPDRRHLEAVAHTRVMRFEDDVAIDVRTATSSTTIVEVRSRSRVGERDRGVNRRRIRFFFEALR